MIRPRSIEFSTKTREKALKRAAGYCECDICVSGVRLPLEGYPIEFHHYEEAQTCIERGKDPEYVRSLENCKVVRKRPCHAILTAKFKAQCGKADRVRRANNGAKKPAPAKIKSPGFPSSRKESRIEKQPVVNQSPLFRACCNNWE